MMANHDAKRVDRGSLFTMVTRECKTRQGFGGEIVATEL